MPILQIFSKVGVVQSKSWKLRNESSDLPIDLLCNKCQYFSSDLHSTRASHVMVLELIIDRFISYRFYLLTALTHKFSSKTKKQQLNTKKRRHMWRTECSDYRLYEFEQYISLVAYSLLNILFYRAFSVFQFNV